MKKRIIPVILMLIFIGIFGAHFVRHYLFRIQPPSDEWSKEIVISHGKISETPKIIGYKGGYIIVHNDENGIKLIEIDKAGNIIIEKWIEDKYKYINDINLLSNGEYIYINWITTTNSIDNIINIKLDEDLNILDKWMINDVKESYQIDESVMVIGYNNGIEFMDFKNNKKFYIDEKLPTKISGTKTREGYIATYMCKDNKSFYDNTVTYKSITLDKDWEKAKERKICKKNYSSRDKILSTATAYDENFGYILVERIYAPPKSPAIYGEIYIIKFPLDKINTDKALVQYDEPDEKKLKIFPTDQFKYSLVSISSGEEGRFLIGYARKYGNSERQFDILDFSIKDGVIIRNSYMEKSKEGSIMPWISGDMAVFCNQTKLEEYDLCLTSQNEEFMRINNEPRRSEVRLALIDTILDILNSLFSLFTTALGWLLPSFVLISIVSLFGYKLSNRMKRLAFAMCCISAALFKLFSIMNLFYGKNMDKLPVVVKPSIIGGFICIMLSGLCLISGYVKYKNDLDKNPDVMPILAFTLVAIIDGFLTQFVFVPYIM